MFRHVIARSLMTQFHRIFKCIILMINFAPNRWSSIEKLVMRMKKLILYGDSNTYGYDPERMGMRYPEGVRWASLVAQSLRDEYEVVNEGMNGRPLPVLPYDERYLNKMLSDMAEDDVLIMMLGTNDILLTNRPDAASAIMRMDAFLSSSMIQQRVFQMMVIAPPHVGAGEKSMHRYYEESIKMNEGFRALCSKKKVHFANSAEWNIPISYDMAHFTAEGHRIFSECVLRELRNLAAWDRT